MIQMNLEQLKAAADHHTELMYVESDLEYIRDAAQRAANMPEVTCSLMIMLPDNIKDPQLIPMPTNLFMMTAAGARQVSAMVMPPQAEPDIVSTENPVLLSLDLSVSDTLGIISTLLSYRQTRKTEVRDELTKLGVKC